MRKDAAVPRNWLEVRRAAVADEQIDDAGVAEERQRLEGEVFAHRLAEIRKARRVSQQQLAGAMGVTQSRVSRIERGDIARAELSTLRAYVEALGCRVHVIAGFGDEEVAVG